MSEAAAAVGAVETIVTSVEALRGIVTELRTAIGDHQLLGDAERIIGDIEAAVKGVPEAATTVEKVAEGVWSKIVAGFDDLFHPHKADIIAANVDTAKTVASAVNKHTETVAAAVNTAVTSGQPVATGPQKAGTRPPVGGATAGAPAPSQPLPGPKPAQPAPAETVDTGKVITVPDDEGNMVQQPVMDAPHGASEHIVIS